VRKRRTKAAAEPEPVATEEAAVQQAAATPQANDDGETEVEGEPRRGWWQRTFG
jgi:ribonuclease E